MKIRDMSFTRCMFERCGLSLTTDLHQIAEIKRVTLTDCAENGCHISPAILSQVKISGLATNDLFILWCPYFDRVVISGETGAIRINAWAGPNTFQNALQKPFDAFREKFYADVEWALDISKARFKDFDMAGVPGRLIRRDPDSQLLVTRERALALAVPGWADQLDRSNKLWPFMVKLFLDSGAKDTVLVAPLGAEKRDRDPLLKGLQELRRIGLAEPD